MKKIFMVFALMAMLMLPLTSFSMTAMEEGDLSSVTGQAGVSINLDVRVDLVAETLAWGDADGFVADHVSVTSGVGQNNAGWVGLSDLEVSNLRIRADQMMLAGDFVQKKLGNFTAAVTSIVASTGAYMLDNSLDNAALVSTLSLSAGFVYDDYETWESTDITKLVGGTVITMTQAGTYATTGAALQAANVTYGADALALQAEITSENFTPFAPLTIDVATGTYASAPHGVGITFVRIGTGSLQISMDSMVGKVELGPSANFPTYPQNGIPALQYQLGSLYLGELFLRIGGNSYVDIFNARGADTQGVSIYANLTIKDFGIGTLAWGDADGIDWQFTNEAGDTAGTTKLHTTDTELETPATGDVDPIADAAGWVGLKKLNIDRIDVLGQIDIDVATDVSDWTYVQIGFGDGLNLQLSGLTATAALGPGELISAGTPAVPEIPAVLGDDPATTEVVETDFETTPAVPGVAAVEAVYGDKPDLNQELGEIYMSDVDVTVTGALKLGARADGSQGITIDLQQISVDISDNLTVSWGDLDGDGTAYVAAVPAVLGDNPATPEVETDFEITPAVPASGSRAGYVGLVGLNIDGLSLRGKVTIDVATIDEAAVTTAATIEDMMYLGYRENNLSPTIVHIGLGTGNATEATMDSSFNFVGDALGIEITSLMGNVVFDSVPGLNLTPNTMGMLYVGGLKVGINGWVDIAAH